MKRRIILVGGSGFATELAKSILKLNPDMKVSVVERLITPFDPEPIILHNYRDSDTIPPIIYDTKPNKFMDKPKNNFKKR